MSVLSHFKNTSYGSIMIHEPGWSSRLPVVFIPQYVVDKLTALKLDYKEVFGKLGYNGFYRGYGELDEGTGGTNNKLKEFTKIVGINECIALEALNRKMFNGDCSIQSFFNYSLSESDYVKEILKITEQLSRVSDEKTYTIENNSDCFFVIMKYNSFSTFNETYKEMSKELCSELLDFIDESFVYQSVFFKSL